MGKETLKKCGWSDCLTCPYERCIHDIEDDPTVPKKKPGRPKSTLTEEELKARKRESCRKYYQTHKEKLKADQREYYREHKEHYQQYHLEYNEKNNYKRRALARERYYRNMKDQEFVEKERIRARERYQRKKATV